MHERARQRVGGWGLWMVLLGGTALGSAWIEEHRSPVIEDSALDVDSDPFADDFEPPRIVFPAMGENPNWHDDAIEDAHWKGER